MFVYELNLQSLGEVTCSHLENLMLQWGAMTELRRAKLQDCFQFLLHSIGEKFNKDNIGLYRDDGLACFKNNNGHHNDKIRKELIKIFQTYGLKLEIE